MRMTQVHRDVFIATSILNSGGVVKCDNPRTPLVTCNIGDNCTTKALIDLGVSVNLLTFWMYKELGLTNLKPVNLILQLADRYAIHPRGIIEDILVNVSDFYYHVDFIIEDTQSTDNHAPIILRCPFLATTNGTIIVQMEQ